MKLPFFKKKQKLPSASFKKYDSIARQRKMNLATERLKAFNPRIKFPKKLLLIPLFLLLIGGAAVLLTSTSFRVKQVNVYGDSDKDALILQDLSSVKGRSIFLIRSADIANTIKSKYENIESVYVYKYIPDRIEVEIVKSLPALVFSSFEKTTLVKKDGSTLGDITSLGNLKLLDYEIKVLNGEKDLNASYIKDAFLSDLPEDQRKDFKFETVSDADKQAKYDKIKLDVTTKVATYRNSIKDFLSKSEYVNLPFVFSYVSYSDASDAFNTALEVSDGLKFRNLNALNSTFTSQYTLEEDTDSGTQILFSSKRAISEQFLDLDSIIVNGWYLGAQIIDLRSEKYSIIP